MWHISLAVTESSLIQHTLLLSTEEQNRASLYTSKPGFRRFVVARSMLRRLLATYVACSPSELTFDYGPHGKPQLAGESAIQFNLAHSAERAVYAISHQQPVGVDIEHIDRKINIERLAARFFSKAEHNALQQISAATRQHEFLRLWTAKEAVIKATGKSLAQMISQFEIKKASDGSPRIHAPEFPHLEKIFLSHQSIDDEYVAAVALLPDSHTA